MTVTVTLIADNADDLRAQAQILFSLPKFPAVPPLPLSPEPQATSRVEAEPSMGEASPALLSDPPKKRRGRKPNSERPPAAGAPLGDSAATQAAVVENTVSEPAAPPTAEDATDAKAQSAAPGNDAGAASPVSMTRDEFKKAMQDLAGGTVEGFANAQKALVESGVASGYLRDATDEQFGLVLAKMCELVAS